MSVTDAVVTAATAADLGGINEIYNHYVEATAVTFDVEPKSMAWRREWFGQFGERGHHRLLVARSDGAVLGYACSHTFRPRAAYGSSVETSVYLSADHLGQGIGSALYAALLGELDREDVHRAYGGIAMPNPGSVRLHERFGFRRVGYFSEQGRKFDRYWDVAWYELRFPRHLPAS